MEHNKKIVLFCLAVLSFGCVATAGTVGMRNVQSSVFGENTSKTMVLDENNAPSALTSSYSSFADSDILSSSKLFYKDAKLSEGNHCSLRKYGYIAKDLSRGIETINVVYSHDTDDTAGLKLLTGKGDILTQNLEDYEYVDSTMVESGVDVNICGDFFKLQALDNLTIESLTVKYSCLESDNEHTYKYDQTTKHFKCVTCGEIADGSNVFEFVYRNKPVNTAKDTKFRTFNGDFISEADGCGFKFSKSTAYASVTSFTTKASEHANLHVLMSKGVKGEANFADYFDFYHNDTKLNIAGITLVGDGQTSSFIDYNLGHISFEEGIHTFTIYNHTEYKCRLGYFKVVNDDGSNPYVCGDEVYDAVYGNNATVTGNRGKWFSFNDGNSKYMNTFATKEGFASTITGFSTEADKSVMFRYQPGGADGLGSDSKFTKFNVSFDVVATESIDVKLCNDAYSLTKGVVQHYSGTYKNVNSSSSSVSIFVTQNLGVEMPINGINLTVTNFKLERILANGQKSDCWSNRGVWYFLNDENNSVVADYPTYSAIDNKVSYKLTNMNATPESTKKYFLRYLPDLSNYDLSKKIDFSFDVIFNSPLDKDETFTYGRDGEKNVTIHTNTATHITYTNGSSFSSGSSNIFTMSVKMDTEVTETNYLEVVITNFEYRINIEEEVSEGVNPWFFDCDCACSVAPAFFGKDIIKASVSDFAGADFVLNMLPDNTAYTITFELALSVNGSIEYGSGENTVLLSEVVGTEMNAITFTSESNDDPFFIRVFADNYAPMAITISSLAIN